MLKNNLKILFNLLIELNYFCRIKEKLFLILEKEKSILDLVSNLFVFFFLGYMV